jgi:DNA-binding transcriptional ArsR family regulator
MGMAFDEVNDFLKALASETRQRILLDVFGDGGERTVGEVAAIAGLGQSTASEHLATLRRAGILTSRREGKETYYRPDRARILASLHRLMEVVSHCCRE